MSQYRFMEDGISDDDLAKLIDLTQEGALDWMRSNQYHAIKAQPSVDEARYSRAASEEVVGENLRGVRFGYHPDSTGWHYLRLTDHSKDRHYVEQGSNEELIPRADQLYRHALADARTDIDGPDDPRLDEVVDTGPGTLHHDLDHADAPDGRASTRITETDLTTGDDDLDWLLGIGRWGQ